MAIEDFGQSEDGDDRRLPSLPAPEKDELARSGFEGALLRLILIKTGFGSEVSRTPRAPRKQLRPGSPYRRRPQPGWPGLLRSVSTATLRREFG